MFIVRVYYEKIIMVFDNNIYYPGLPLLYVGALTVPLGFVRTGIYRQYHSYDYGYEQA